MPSCIFTHQVCQNYTSVCQSRGVRNVAVISYAYPVIPSVIRVIFVILIFNSKSVIFSKLLCSVAQAKPIQLGARVQVQRRCN